MNSLYYYLGFSHCMGIGPVTFNELIEQFGDVEKAYVADFKELTSVLGEKLAQDFDRFRHTFRAEEKYEELQRKKIHIITREDAYFPQALRDIQDAPICLYAKGDILAIDLQKERCVAIVGTRKATQYGLQITKQLSAQLTAAGLLVVSGMASGIDAKAHWAALDAGGKTIAFLGCGVDKAFPMSNVGLYQKIIDGGGLVLSEFPPGMTALKGTFVSRNRLISGLSEAVIVIEGSKTSGALITARCAAEQGKEVFAVPGLIHSELAAGPHMLIRNGAQLVTSAQDVLEVFSMKSVVPSQKHTPQVYLQLSQDEQKIIDAIQKGNQTLDELVLCTQKPIVEILQIISMLEIQGYLTKNSDGTMSVV